MAFVDSSLRSRLETATQNARDAAEAAAEVALVMLAVERDEPFATMSQEQRSLRVKLREKLRQLGGFQALVAECAYAQWHRMLFARFLAENHLLMHPTEHVAVTLEDCADLAHDEGEPDAWALAARYAAVMLPGIFRVDDPLLAVRFTPEARQTLERLLAELPALIFAAEDSLGWVYQYWQAKRKDEINAKGGSEKVLGADVGPVTQLFTEEYMVEFLLHNSLGAWWVSRHPHGQPPVPFPSLRLNAQGCPEAGNFPGWPAQTADLKVLDPCCGSGHFLVSAFAMLRSLRMHEEGLSAREAGDAVLRDNLFGLDIDARCVQITTFSLALEAWKSGGFRQLPLPHVACCGIPVGGKPEDWTRLAQGNIKIANGLRAMFEAFQNAPELGSLLDPTYGGDLLTAGFEELQPYLERALVTAPSEQDPAAAVFGAAATGLARAAGVLIGRYHLVITNVPYLQRTKQGDVLRRFCGRRYPDSKTDLATVFVERCASLCTEGGSYALVTPQNWLFLGSYKELRKRLLVTQQWNMVVKLGAKAFQTPMWDLNIVLLIMTTTKPILRSEMAAIDASAGATPDSKAEAVRSGPVRRVEQLLQYHNPDSRVTLQQVEQGPLLSLYASAYNGTQTGDDPRVKRYFWELPRIAGGWRLFQGPPDGVQPFGGMDATVRWQGENSLTGLVAEKSGYVRGRRAFGRAGVLISQVGRLPASLYRGHLFDHNAAVIVPKNPQHLPAIWAFCRSPLFREAVRKIDQKLMVTNATLVKVPFDLARWQAEVPEQLPEPGSDAPTQWIFQGNPAHSTQPLQTAVVRLLGYRWPHQEQDGLDGHVVGDGIVCVPPLGGAQPAAEQLRALLAKAMGENWSPAQQEALLAGVGFGGKTLDAWLRDGFFKQHCTTFHNRPFIWHIWDGRKDGFSALVNYHRLDRTNLDRLIFTYLGAWIHAQREQSNAATPGAEDRLVAALELQRKLQAISEGEPPWDIYARWKPISQQPLGWDPDLNDGVRVNIRPFVAANVLRSKFTIHWKKDRGADKDGGERHNDLHFTLTAKLAARRP